MKSLSRLFWNRSRDVRALLDAALVGVATVVAFWLRLEALPSAVIVLGTAAAMVALHVLLTLATGLDRRSWSRVGVRDLAWVGGVLAADTLLLVVLLLWPGAALPSTVPVSVPMIAGPTAFMLLAAARIGARAWATRRRAGERERILVVGAHGAGPPLARALREEGHTIVGFLEEDPSRRELLLDGIPVLGKPEDAQAIAARHRVDLVILASSSLDGTWPSMRRKLESEGVRCRSLPGLDDILLAERPKDIQAAIRRFTEADRPKNILVVGGAGYIGSALVPILLEEGYEVRVLDLLLYGREPLAGVADHPRLEVLQGDFRHVPRLVEAMQGIDTVIHLGAIVGDPACALNEDLTVETNLMATKLVADVAKGHGIRRFVFASTCSVYGASDGLLDEESKLHPLSLYARTKIAAERLLLRMKASTFRPILLRFGTVYGFSGRTRFDLVVNLLAAKAVTDGKMTLFGGGQFRPFIHVNDVAEAIAKVLATPDERLRHDIYNVGSDEQNYTLQQAAEVIKSLVPSAEIVEMGAGPDHRNYRVSFRRLREEVGFTPQWSLAQGAQQVIDAIRSGKVTDLKDPRYSNVAFLREGGLDFFDKRVYGMVVDALEEAIPEV